MSEVVAIAYPDERRAAEALEAIKRLHAAGAIDLEDAVAASKNAEGAVKLDGAISRTAEGTAAGLVLGTMVGLVFLAPVLGAAFGVVSGALAGKLADVYHVDDFVLEVGSNMPPGSSAILMLVRGPAADPERVLAELRHYGGTVIRTTLPDDAEARLRAALGPPAAGAA